MSRNGSRCRATAPTVTASKITHHKKDRMVFYIENNSSRAEGGGLLYVALARRSDSYKKNVGLGSIKQFLVKFPFFRDKRHECDYHFRSPPFKMQKGVFPKELSYFHTLI